MITTDRRVRRSRSALMRAAVSLVAERGTSNVAVSEIAEAADVARQLVYQHFGERDALLLEAALNLVRTELVEPAGEAPGDPTDRDRVLAMARHFARYRSFYRALLTGPCAYRLNKALTELLSPINEQVVRQLFGAHLAPDVIDQLTLFVTGGAAAVINTWVVEAPEPLDPEAFTDRLMRMPPVFRKVGDA